MKVNTNSFEKGIDGTVTIMMQCPVNNCPNEQKCTYKQYASSYRHKKTRVDDYVPVILKSPRWHFKSLTSHLLRNHSITEVAQYSISDSSIIDSSTNDNDRDNNNIPNHSTNGSSNDDTNVVFGEYHIPTVEQFDVRQTKKYSLRRRGQIALPAKKSNAL